MFFPNEPTDFEMKNMGYPARREEVMEKKSPEKRWVRFRKRTHREGVFCRYLPFADGIYGLFWLGSGRFRFALGVESGVPGARYLNPNGSVAASHL